MRLGAVFPQGELPADGAAVRAWLEGVVELGFDHILVFDHVVGAHRPSHAGLPGYYRLEHLFHEALVVLGFAAAVAPELGLATGVVVSPQRQTALLAKQMAEIDVLSGGRLRCGIGVGHGPVQYEALGMDFESRGPRIEEQIELLRRFWTEEYFDFDGRWDKIVQAGINPRPVQRPIPIWIGGSSDAALRRAARLADGFFPNTTTAREGGWPATLERLHGWIEDAGRDPDAFGLEPWIDVGEGTPDDWAAKAEEWRQLGAKYLSLSTALAPVDTGPGVCPPEYHLERLRDVVAAIS
jgi:probable F420-dependent oxidoreductase